MPVYPTVPQEMDETVVVHNESDFVTEVAYGDAEELYRLVRTRKENRTDDRYDAIVVAKAWATDPKYDVVPSKVLLAGEVNDYSEKAVRLKGAFAVDLVELSGWVYINNVLSVVDTEDHPEGTTYMPKKAVKTIVRPQIEK